MPSPGAWSGFVPSSSRTTVCPPGETVTLTGPTDCAQLILSAASFTGLPAVAEIVSKAGSNRDCTGWLEHVRDFAALSRLALIVLPRAATGSPPLSSKFLIARQSRD